MECAAGQPLGQAVMAERYLMHRGVIGERGNDQFGVRGGLPGRGGHARAERRERPGLFGRAVPHAKLMVSIGKPRRHVRTHRPQPEKRNPHRMSPIA